MPPPPAEDEESSPFSGNGHLLSVAEKHGVDKILPKPFGPSQINELVRSVLN